MQFHRGSWLSVSEKARFLGFNAVRLYLAQKCLSGAVVSDSISYYSNRTNMILDENLRKEEAPTVVLTEYEIFTQIWTSPRIVFRFLNATHYDKHVYLLLMLGGIGNGFEQASRRAFAENWPMVGVIGIAVILGAILGLISNNFYAGAIMWFGKLFNGKANFHQLRRVVAYALVPTISALILVLLEVLIYGESMFRRGFDVMSMGQPQIIFFYLAAITQMVLGIWGFVLTVAGVSEVQKISTGAAFWNVLLPGLVIAAVVFIVMYSMRF